MDQINLILSAIVTKFAISYAENFNVGIIKITNPKSPKNIYS